MLPSDSTPSYYGSGHSGFDLVIGAMVPVIPVAA